MRLAEAYNLLLEDGVADNHRYFAEVYKTFQFKDEDSLKDYVDFILHEPAHWMRGFPPKLTSKNAFAKPKTALIKLLKKPEVQADLGEGAAELAHTTIWTVFKREHEAILGERTAHGGRRREPYRHVVEHVGIESSEEEPEEEQTEEPQDDSDAITVESLEEAPPLTKPPQPFVPRLHMKVAEEQTERKEAINQDVGNNRTDLHRIETLKAVCLKLSETLPPAVSDAFRILIAAV